MLTFEDAKRVGTIACLDKLGRDFVRKHRDTACSAYGNNDGYAFCFVGIDDQPDIPWDSGPIVLDDTPTGQFPYRVSCNVAYETGKITFLECVLPDARV